MQVFQMDGNGPKVRAYVVKVMQVILMDGNKVRVKTEISPNILHKLL